jgi:two-component sensor histidine kinase
MIELISRFFNTDGFMPHGMCYLWQPGILSLHIVSDALIMLAYFSIPFTLLHFVRKRTDLRFHWIVPSFAIFIIACGLTHLLDISTIWYPTYWLSGGIKAATALASVTTAIMLVKLVPAAMRVVSPAVLQAANENLAREVLERKRAEQNALDINASLEARVAERTSQLATVNAALEQRVSARTSELKERESLLQEVHHRVKNNLQVISSLINMQVRGLADESTQAALRECQSRVATMAQIHEMLYQSADYARVPFAKYARDLAARIFSASETSAAVALKLDLQELSLPVEQAIPCGLILNELVGNSLKHAFPNAAGGTICVDLRLASSKSAILSVSDDGIGLSPTLHWGKLGSLGVQLVMTLVEQLAGKLEIIRQPGSTFRITFPLESHA